MAPRHDLRGEGVRFQFEYYDHASQTDGPMWGGTIECESLEDAEQQALAVVYRETIDCKPNGVPASGGFRQFTGQSQRNCDAMVVIRNEAGEAVSIASVRAVVRRLKDVREAARGAANNP